MPSGKRLPDSTKRGSHESEVSRTETSPTEWQQWLRDIVKISETPSTTVKRPDRRPHVRVNILQKEFRALLDTGAVVTVVGSKVAKHLLNCGNTPETVNTIVQLANGCQTRCEKKFTFICEIDGRLNTIEAVYLPNLTSDVIFGIDVLERLNLMTFNIKLDSTPPENVKSLHVVMTQDETTTEADKASSGGARDNLWYERVKECAKFPSKRGPKYALKDGKVYRGFIKKPKGSGSVSKPQWKLCVPADKIGDVLKESHDFASAAHFGVNKTTKVVGESYFWPGWYRMVRRYVQQCKVCQKNKAEQTKPTGELHNRPPRNYYMGFERESRVSGALMRPRFDERREEDAPETAQVHSERMKQFTILYDDVQKNLKSAFIQQAKFCDLRRRDVRYKPGQESLKKSKVLSSAADAITGAIRKGPRGKKLQVDDGRDLRLFDRDD